MMSREIINKRSLSTIKSSVNSSLEKQLNHTSKLVETTQLDRIIHNRQTIDQLRIQFYNWRINLLLLEISRQVASWKLPHQRGTLDLLETFSKSLQLTKNKMKEHNFPRLHGQVLDKWMVFILRIFLETLAPTTSRNRFLKMWRKSRATFS